MKNLLRSTLMPLSLFILMTDQTFAGPASSGGGNALVCFQSDETAKKIKSIGYIEDRFLSEINFIETFDLYEAKKPRGFATGSMEADLLAPESNETPRDYALRIANRLKVYHPVFYADLVKKIEDLTSHRTILTNDRIEQVYDVNPSDRIDRKNCLFTTLAAQQVDGGLLTVFLDNKLYNHPLHSSFSKNVLLVHEAVYALARENQTWARDSRLTRFVVSLLISKTLKNRQLAPALLSLFGQNHPYTTRVGYSLEQADYGGFFRHLFKDVNNRLNLAWFENSYQFKGESLKKLDQETEALAKNKGYELNRQFRPQFEKIVKESGVANVIANLVNKPELALAIEELFMKMTNVECHFASSAGLFIGSKTYWEGRVECKLYTTARELVSLLSPHIDEIEL